MEVASFVEALLCVEEELLLLWKVATHICYLSGEKSHLTYCMMEFIKCVGEEKEMEWKEGLA